MGIGSRAVNEIRALAPGLGPAALAHLDLNGADRGHEPTRSGVGPQNRKCRRQTALCRTLRCGLEMVYIRRQRRASGAILELLVLSLHHVDEIAVKQRY